jgi:hypothetical protein
MTEQEMILVIAMEECNEVAQAISKILRFGVDSTHPISGDTNNTQLETEMTDLFTILFILVSRGITKVPSAEKMMEKTERIIQSLELSLKLGRVQSIK